ncbi:Hypothetical predicted protein [Scomber scombrus]|uniref:Uncharacterized protein n=1 Tax=Scomber scombrus TaxID=13677 RepID=A0AAV1QB90_SCOSC
MYCISAEGFNSTRLAHDGRRNKRSASDETLLLLRLLLYINTAGRTSPPPHPLLHPPHPHLRVSGFSVIKAKHPMGPDPSHHGRKYSLAFHCRRQESVENKIMNPRTFPDFIAALTSEDEDYSEGP